MNRLMRFVLILWLSFAASVAAKELNVYVGFEDDQLRSKIHQFNECLQQTQILTRYQIEPFINHFPLHITLYLAAFEENKWPRVIEMLKLFTQQRSSFSIKTSAVYLTQSNYLMLDVDFKTEYNPHPKLQKFSDTIVLKLHNDRDFVAPIPSWAASIPVKKKAFVHYGSPNVFFEFSPHFTLLAKIFSDRDVENQFRLDLKSALTRCTIAPLTLKAKFIGLGEVDSFGQITKQLGQFPLRTEIPSTYI